MKNQKKATLEDIYRQQQMKCSVGFGSNSKQHLFEELPEEKKRTNRVTFRLTNHELKTLNDYCRVHGVKKADFIRDELLLPLLESSGFNPYD